MTRYVIGKLIAALDDLSDEELMQLVEVFRAPSAGPSVSRMIEEMLVLRKAERRTRGLIARRSVRSGKQDDVVNAVQSRDSESSLPFEASQDEFKAALGDVLCDRKLFPSTRDVINALNAHFPLNLEYAKYRRNGRRPAIRKCWNLLASLPSSERRRLLSRFFKAFQHETSEGRSYSELFRLLTRSE